MLSDGGCTHAGPRGARGEKGNGTVLWTVRQSVTKHGGRISLDLPISGWGAIRCCMAEAVSAGNAVISRFRGEFRCQAACH